MVFIIKQLVGENAEAEKIYKREKPHFHVVVFPILLIYSDKQAEIRDTYFLSGPSICLSEKIVIYNLTIIILSITPEFGS